MSSLQKFHRRTNGGEPAVRLIGSEALVAGAGFWLGTAGDGTSRMYVAPKSTEAYGLTYGSYGSSRNARSDTDGLTNTNTLAGFGQTAHPAAYYCKNLTTGGYNTWYLPARIELNTLYSNKSKTPFASSDQFINAQYVASTEASNSTQCWRFDMGTGYGDNNAQKNSGTYRTRAVRRALV